MRRPDRHTLTHALEVFPPLDVDRLVCYFVPTGSRKGGDPAEIGRALLIFLTTQTPADEARYRSAVGVVTNWLVEQMTYDQRGEHAAELCDPSRDFAGDLAAEMVREICAALRCE